MTPIYILAGTILALLLVVLFPKKDSVELGEEKNSHKPKQLNEQEQIAYQYSCVYNSLVLFANTVNYLKSLSAPAFDPMFELESEFDIGFTDYTLDKNFENGTIKENLKQDLLDFKKSVNDVPSHLWNYDDLDTHETWKNIRSQANILLTKMGETRREYDHGFTTIIYVDK
jgi:hypothetical protein